MQGAEGHDARSRARGEAGAPAWRPAAFRGPSAAATGPPSGLSLGTPTPREGAERYRPASPASAHCSSWSPVTPLTPTPPITLASAKIGIPPGDA